MTTENCKGIGTSHQANSNFPGVVNHFFFPVEKFQKFQQYKFFSLTLSKKMHLINYYVNKHFFSFPFLPLCDTEGCVLNLNGIPIPSLYYCSYFIIAPAESQDISLTSLC